MAAGKLWRESEGYLYVRLLFPLNHSHHCFHPHWPNRLPVQDLPLPSGSGVPPPSPPVSARPSVRLLNFMAFSSALVRLGWSAFPGVFQALGLTASFQDVRVGRTAVSHLLLRKRRTSFPWAGSFRTAGTALISSVSPNPGGWRARRKSASTLGSQSLSSLGAACEQHPHLTSVIVIPWF